MGSWLTATVGGAVLVAATAAGCGRVGFEIAGGDGGRGDGSSSDSGATGDDAPDAAMAPKVLVQQQNDTSAIGVKTFSLVMPMPVQAGDTLLVVADFTVTTSTTPIASCTDDLGDTFRPVAVDAVDGATQVDFVIATVAATGTPTIQIVLDSGEGDIELRAFEYSGVATTDPVDVAQHASGSSTGSDAVTMPALVTTRPGDLVFAAAIGWQCTVIVGTGFTSVSTFDDDLVETQPAPAPGSYVVTASTNVDSPWTVVAAALRGEP